MKSIKWSEKSYFKSTFFKKIYPSLKTNSLGNVTESFEDKCKAETKLSKPRQSYSNVGVHSVEWKFYLSEYFPKNNTYNGIAVQWTAQLMRIPKQKEMFVEKWTH